MEQGLTKNKIISELTRSPHGDLAQYAPIGSKAAVEDPNFFAHLVAWNNKHGQIRDAKVALPVLALTAPALAADAELRDNALAHIVSLDPRNLVRALRFATGKKVVSRALLYRTIERYLRELEATPKRFDRVALQHRKSLHELYSVLHVKPASDHVRATLKLGKGARLQKTGVFADVANLANMAPDEIAGTIMRHRIPFLTAMGALGKKMKEPAVVQALIGAMSPTELVTNSKMLERLGVKTDPALRAAYEAGLQKVSGSSAAVLKTTTAADAIGGATGEKLRGAQEKQIDKMGVKGDWLVLGDKSGSMAHSIEMSRQVAGLLARVAEGNVHLVFFNTSPTYINATGKTYDELAKLTKREVAGGGTSIGCGLQYLLEQSVEVDGIAIVSDGAEHSAPHFHHVYAEYAAKFGKSIPVYLFVCPGEPNSLTGVCARAGLALQEFDLTRGVDYYSLPNLIQTMRTNRFSLVDEILAQPLLRLEDVFKQAA